MVSNFYVRGVGKVPIKMRCNHGLIDDGKNCIKKNMCSRKPCTNNKNGCLKCSGVEIVTKFKNRLTCNEGEELEDGLCFKKCVNGYVANGSKCVKGLHKNRINQNKTENKSIINYLGDFIKNITTKTEKFTTTMELNNNEIQLIIGLILFILLIIYYN